MTKVLLACDAAKFSDLVNAALAAAIPADEILNQGMISAMGIAVKK